MTELADLVDAYKRETALPGTFAATFPAAIDSDIVGSLEDAFADAQLDGFFHAVTLDLDDHSLSPDISTAGAGLIIMYAGMRVVRQQIMQLGSRTRVKAGPVEYENERSAGALTEILKALKARKDELILNALRGGGTSVFVMDGYRSRSHFYGGFLEWEMPLQRWCG